MFVCLCVCFWLLIGRNHTIKLSNTTKQLLLDLFVQEVQVRAFIVLHLFHSHAFLKIQQDNAPMLGQRSKSTIYRRHPLPFLFWNQVFLLYPQSK